MERLNRELLERYERVERQNADLARQNADLVRQFRDLSKKVESIAASKTATAGRVEPVRSRSPVVVDPNPTAASPAQGNSARDSAIDHDLSHRSAGGSGSESSASSAASRGRRLNRRSDSISAIDHDLPHRTGDLTTEDAFHDLPKVRHRQQSLLPLRGYYNHDTSGFQFESEDEEFILKLRTLIQTDARIYQQPNQNPVASGIYLPRARLYFTGRVTKPIEYQLALQRAYTSLDVLNMYVNFHYDDRFQIKFGRYKAPFTYEFYKIQVPELISQERSLFSVNFGMNRQPGLMGWGYLFEKRLEYAVGVFDGPRKSYQDFNNSKDVDAFFNFKPFEDSERFAALRDLNLGGSVDYGIEDNPILPDVLRTSANASSSALNTVSLTNSLSNLSPVNNAAVPFLAFNRNVRERGPRNLWELHAAYYYKGLSLLGAWDVGRIGYGLAGKNVDTHLPTSGYFVQGAYILTGETMDRRALVDPIHPFDLRPAHFGLGAFEIQGRFSELALGNQVFTDGLADPNLWTNNLYMTDAGLNWYLNKSLKIYLDWEHAVFGRPVFFAPGPRLQKTSDLFWLRVQLYF